MAQSNQSTLDSPNASTGLQSSQMSIDTIDTILNSSSPPPGVTTRSSMSEGSKSNKDFNQGRAKNLPGNKNKKNEGKVEKPPRQGPKASTTNNQTSKSKSKNKNTHSQSQSFSLGPKWSSPPPPMANQSRPHKIIPDDKRGDLGAISDALNMVYSSLETSQANFMAYVEHSESKFEAIENEFSNIYGKVDSLSGKLDQQIKKHDQLKNQFVSLDAFKELGNKFESFKMATDEKILSLCSNLDECNQLLDSQNKKIVNSRLDHHRLVTENNLLKERVNTSEIRAKRLHITIDGLHEIKDISVKDLVIKRCNEDAQANLQSNDFKKIHLIGKPRPKSNSRPRPIKIELADDNARDQLLACRGKLKNPDNSTSIWINEDLPDSYRRRKVMLRDLVKHISLLPLNTPQKSKLVASIWMENSIMPTNWTVCLLSAIQVQFN